ncbi:capping protein inhibiting regulator of actin dynamics-like isoform X2 [Mya arenaria]|uniref:capping protein inhibiting regulator of actin dynamics-like isoform X2 n=1 Tax=Mya arenaria TaxID=6604 RepID=UPI0022E140B1|nr:capping protein inhibiting regulator of actin dynamics-like isoform X2 [Mya arenaria]
MDIHSLRALTFCLIVLRQSRVSGQGDSWWQSWSWGDQGPPYTAKAASGPQVQVGTSSGGSQQTTVSPDWTWWSSWNSNTGGQPSRRVNTAQTVSRQQGPANTWSTSWKWSSDGSGAQGPAISTRGAPSITGMTASAVEVPVSFRVSETPADKNVNGLITNGSGDGSGLVTPSTVGSREPLTSGGADGDPGTGTTVSAWQKRLLETRNRNMARLKRLRANAPSITTTAPSVKAGSSWRERMRQLQRLRASQRELTSTAAPITTESIALIRQRLLEERRRQQMIHEQRLQEQKLLEQKMEEQRLKEQRLEEQKLQEQILKEQKLEEQRLKEQRLEEQRLEEQRLQEKRLLEQKLEEQRLKEKRLQEQILEEQRLQEQKLLEQTLKEEKLLKQRLEEERVNEMRLQEQRLQEERLKKKALQEQRLKEQKLLEQRLEQQRLNEQRLLKQKMDEQRLQELRLQEQRLHELRQQEKNMLEKRLQELKMQEQAASLGQRQTGGDITSLGQVHPGVNLGSSIFGPGDGIQIRPSDTLPSPVDMGRESSIGATSGEPLGAFNPGEALQPLQPSPGEPLGVPITSFKEVDLNSFFNSGSTLGPIDSSSSSVGKAQTGEKGQNVNQPSAGIQTLNGGVMPKVETSKSSSNFKSSVQTKTTQNQLFGMISGLSRKLKRP